MMRQQIAWLGDFQLESGDVIYDCRVGYRTKGQLVASKSNAVLVTPWFQGTSRKLGRQIGPGRLVDSSKYFVIAVDALGNGVSSSPSNSVVQPGRHFPNFTIRDIVESQYQMVTRTLGLTRLKAVVGLSMGGMQVFEWLVSHPAFMDKGVSIVGSPQSQPSDRQRLRAYVASLDTSRWTKVGLALLRLAARTAISELRIDPDDHRRQAEAIIAFDIAERFGGSMEAVAAMIRAELFVAGTWGDAEVNPAPGFELARLTRAAVLELDGRCGHQAANCERATLWPAIARFLEC
jgi:homoserine O-acetyltransferase